MYPYGCGVPGEIATAAAARLPDYFFCPDGGYDIYDYRNPGELRIDAVAEALVLGASKTGPVMHDLPPEASCSCAA